MKVIRTKEGMREWSRSCRAQGKTIGFVPTMGYLHQGHLSLVEEAARAADEVVISIYVNPTQFAPGEDLEVYPRSEEEDLRKAQEKGATVGFCPSSLYSEGYQTNVIVEELIKPLCGVSRPTHFIGVATVVTKLFNIVRPDTAIFGKKDYQQLAIIKRVVEDLDQGVTIVGMPIVREADGLAMSSRNAYLTEAERAQAVALSQVLDLVRRATKNGERASHVLRDMALTHFKKFPLLQPEYVEIRDRETFELVTEVHDRCFIALAAKLGTTRLIDNSELD